MKLIVELFVPDMDSIPDLAERMETAVLPQVKEGKIGGTFQEWDDGKGWWSMSVIDHQKIIQEQKEADQSDG